LLSGERLRRLRCRQDCSGTKEFMRHALIFLTRNLDVHLFQCLLQHGSFTRERQSPGITTPPARIGGRPFVRRERIIPGGREFILHLPAGDLPKRCASLASATVDFSILCRLFQHHCHQRSTSTRGDCNKRMLMAKTLLKADVMKMFSVH
jgi:hypothetical protein